MKLISTLLVACLTAPHGVHCDAQNLDLCAAPLQQGEAAPFTGQLLTSALALRLAQISDQCDQRTALARQQAVEDAAIDLKNTMALREMDRQHFDATVQECRSALDSARTEMQAARPWYASPWLWAPLAVVGTSLAFGLLLKTAGQGSRKG